MPQSKHPFRPSSGYIASFATLLMGFFMWWMNHQAWGVSFWAPYAHLDLVYHPLCEPIEMDALYRQPAATYSNLVFFFFGVLIYSYALSDLKTEKCPNNLLLLSPQYSFLFSLIYFITFLASSLYHAAMIRILYLVDLFGIYSISVFYLLYSLWKWLLIKGILNPDQKSKNLIYLSAFLLVLVFSSANYSYATYKLYPLILINAVLIMHTCYFEYHYNTESSKPLLITALLLLLLIPVGYISDSILCKAGLFYYAHTLYHFLACLGVFAFYAYLRSERYSHF